MRVGGEKVIPVDVRILAATNKDLFELVENRQFKEDLFYRINVLNLDIPNLKSRKDDISVLSEYFIKKYCDLYKKNKFSLDSCIIERFLSYDWPGNIRQLENVIQRLVVVHNVHGTQIENFEKILSKLRKSIKNKPDEGLIGTLEEITRKSVLRVLEEENYNKTRAAKRLNISRVTLNNKLN